MSLPISSLKELSLNNTAVVDSTSVPDVVAVNYLEGYEHPVAWFKRYNAQRNDICEDVLSDILNMKKVLLEEYSENRSECVKWKQFGYDMVICYEYTSKGQAEKALEVISDVEHILSSIGIEDLFLNSIKVALNHITFSFKGHLLKLCSNETSVLLEPFLMPTEMDQANKAALFGAQSLFFYDYGIPFAEIAKFSAFKAISFNEHEAEWHFLLAKVFTHWQQMCSSFNQITKEEIDAAEKAVELGKNDHYKLHLAHLYQRMSRYSATNSEGKKHYADAGLKLVKEVLLNGNNDSLALKNCLWHLLKLRSDISDETNEMLEKLVDKLKSSDNPYVHAAIGNYYLYKKEDYEKANFYLKKAFDVNSFGNSLDYVCTFYKIDPNTTQVEPLFVEMLKTHPHPFNVVVILSHLISYLILIKNDLIQALKYIPQLLDFKDDICVRSVKNHRMKFPSSKTSFNFINMLTEKLNGALKNYTLPTDHIEKATEVLQMLKSYKQFVSCLAQEKKRAFRNNNLKKDVSAKDNKPFTHNYNDKEFLGHKNPKQESISVKSKKYNDKEFSGHKNPKQESISVKSKNEGNWRLLKPDTVTNSKIFSRTHHRQMSNSDSQK